MGAKAEETRDPVLTEDELAWLGLWCLWGYAPSSFALVRAVCTSAGDVVSGFEALSTGLGEKAVARLEAAFEGLGDQDIEGALADRGHLELSRLGKEGWVLPVASGRLARVLSPMREARPPYLFGVGDRSVLEKSPARFAAMVGSRRVDRDGRVLAEEIAREVVRAGCGVISGGALGVDTAAHTSALDAGGVTVAVLGVGLDNLYPASNKGLFKRMVEEGGVLLTPFMCREEARPWHFPRRNAIMAAMSLATIVIRAGEFSGSMWTARAASAYGRPVLSVPGDAANKGHAGTNLLLTRGALPLVEPAAVSTLLSCASRGELGRGAQLSLWPRPGKTDCAVIGQQVVESAVSEGEDGPAKKVLDALKLGPAGMDELVVETSMALPEIMRVLLGLELDGRVCRSVGGRYQSV